MQNHKVKTMLIDDEEHALEILETLLKHYPEIEILEKITEPEQAVKAIADKKPDLLFLDILMPRMDAFQLLASIKSLNVNPEVIVTTSYEEYAIKAIRYAAFDFLMKPVEINELSNAIERFRNKKIQSDNNHINNLLNFWQPKKLKFNTRDGIIFIALESIVYLEAYSNYTTIHHSKKEKETVSIHLGEIETKLPAGFFFRISRSVIVNTRYLVKIEKKSNKCYLEKGKEQFILKISQSRIRDLETLFS
ncbi:MAG: LytTR family DNA-binding domain-containing protein [Bacteroidales bacterium]|nr:LytTR family DNA-binding domain-containing protein [Bacteroidales bacterium]